MVEYTVVTTADDGFFEKASLLMRSIQRNTEINDVVCCIPRTVDIDPEDIDAIRSHADIRRTDTGDGGQHSAKYEALREAAETVNTDYLLFVDADTVFLDTLRLPATGDQLYVKPVDLGSTGHAQNESLFQTAFNANDVEYPGRIYRSTVDDVPVPPYMQGGCIGMRNDPELVAEYGRAMKRTYEAIGGIWVYGQVALGVLSEMYDTYLLDERFNFPGKAYWRVPSQTAEDIKLYHYHDMPHLAKLPRTIYRNKVGDIGVSSYWRTRFAAWRSDAADAAYNTYKRFTAG